MGIKVSDTAQSDTHGYNIFDAQSGLVVRRSVHLDSFRRNRDASPAREMQCTEEGKSNCQCGRNELGCSIDY